MDHLIDRLFTRAKKGDEKAGGELSEYLRVRFGVIVRHEVWEEEDREDVLQDALRIVLEKYKTDPSIRRFNDWARGVLDNVIKRYVKKRIREHKMFIRQPESNLGLGPGGQKPDPLLILQKKRLMECLDQVFKRYPRYAPTLNLLLQEWTPREISSELRIKPNYVSVIIYRGRRLLQTCMEKGRI